MKKIIFAALITLSLASVGMAADTNVLSDTKSRVSYAIGMMLGHNWQQQGLDVNPDLAAQAIKDIQSGGPTLLTQAEMQQTLTSDIIKVPSAEEMKNGAKIEVIKSEDAAKAAAGAK